MTIKKKWNWCFTQWIELWIELKGKLSYLVVQYWKTPEDSKDSQGVPERSQNCTYFQCLSAEPFVSMVPWLEIDIKICNFRWMEIQNIGIEASSSDTITTDSGIGSKTEVDTLENWNQKAVYWFLPVCNKTFWDPYLKIFFIEPADLCAGKLFRSFQLTAVDWWFEIVNTGWRWGARNWFKKANLLKNISNESPAIHITKMFL